MFNNVPEYMNILCNKIYQSKTLSDIFADDRIVNIESMFSYNEITKDLSCWTVQNTSHCKA